MSNVAPAAASQRNSCEMSHRYKREQNSRGFRNRTLYRVHHNFRDEDLSKLRSLFILFSIFLVDVIRAQIFAIFFGGEEISLFKLELLIFFLIYEK